ncbi:unnamed protein product [Mytilus edulis]|uniref:Diacylglycerol O-acyltransferase n=1 Tax=Mytilus edulis TaxID=6550 RepID=A0A8S3QLY5_MYTED|nr:unnamed protein product [Mytilus edulis]
MTETIVENHPFPNLLMRKLEILMTDQHQDTEVPLSKTKKSTRRSEEVHALKDSDTTSEYYNNETQDENRRLSQSQGRPASRYGSTEKLLQEDRRRNSQSEDRKKSSKQSGGDEDKKSRHSSGGSRISFQKLPKISDNDSASKYEISNEYPMSDMSNNPPTDHQHVRMVKSKSDDNASAHTISNSNSGRHNSKTSSDVKRSKTIESSIPNQFNKNDFSMPMFYGVNSDRGRQKLLNSDHTISLSNESASSNDLYSNGSMSGIPDQSRQYLSIDMERLKHQKSEEDLSIATLSGYTHHGLRHSFPSSPFTQIIPVDVPKGKCKFFYSIIFLFCSLIVFCPTCVLLSVLLPIIYFIKKLCSCCCCYGNKCQAGELLTKKEMLALRQCQGKTDIYQALLIVEAGLDIHRIQDLINARIVCAEDEEGIKLYPKLTKKIVQTCSGLAWVQDTNFLMKNHVFPMPSSLENLEDLQEYISNRSSRSLTSGHSPWEVQVLQGFGEHRDTILYLRLSSCIMDGMSLMYVLQKSLSDTGYLTAPKLKFSRQNIFLNSLKSLFVGPLVFMQKYLFMKRDFNMFHGDHVHISGKQVMTWSEPYDLEQATRSKQITRSTMNDILLSVTAGCLRTYFNQNGVLNPYDIKSMIAVHYNSGCSYYPTENNNYIHMSVPIPTNTEGAIPRLWKVKHIMDKLSSSALFSVTRGAVWVTSCLFSVGIFQKFWNHIHGKFTCVISNIPGPEGTLTFASKQIKSVIYWVPQLHNMAVGISFLSYGQSIRMAVVAERSVLPNPEVLTRDFIVQMDKLSELLAHRRIPGEYLTKKIETLQQLDDEIHSEPTVHQLQMKMAVIQQEIQDLKGQLDSDGRQRHFSKDQKIRKAAESENAMILTEDDNDIDDDREDGEVKRPFRRRTLSISSRVSRLSTASVSSTARPLAATTPTTPIDFPDDISQDSFRTDGTSHINRPMYRRQQSSEMRDQMQILEYASSPLAERRFRTF